jgi:hypothetical protein
MNGKPVLYKTFVVGVLVLFIGMSVVSSTDNFFNEKPDEYSPLEPVHSSEEKFSQKTTSYMFSVFGSAGPGFYAFYPNGTYRFGEWEGDDFFSGGTWTNDGRYLCCLFENGTLYDIDPETLDACPIGNEGVSLNGLAYNPVNGKLYGASSYDLYEIDMETGNQTYIGGFGSGPNIMIAIAFDMYGVLYGWDVGNDSLWIIDTESGNATLVGPLGFNICYAQDGAFNYYTDILYLVAYTSQGVLLECDEDTGECTFICTLWVGQATAHAISYEDNEPPVTTHILVPPEPDGLNGWYVSDVNVTLNATDDMLGVKEIRYTINGGPEIIIPGDNASFNLSEDGNDILVEFWAVDNAGNTESPKNSFTIDIDQTPPDTCLSYEIIGGNWWRGWDYEFSLIGTDAMSNVNITYYRINSGEWVIYTEPFILSGDGDEILIDYYSVDYAGNIEDVKSATIPRTRASSYLWYHWLFECFPLLHRLLMFLLL